VLTVNQSMVAGRERPKLLALATKTFTGIRGMTVSENGSTGPITCACPGAWRMSVVAPNSDVGTDSI
jgi:hypothetical protein